MADSRSQIRGSVLMVVVFAAACLTSCATAYDKKGVYYKVRAGESISKIAKYYHVPVQELAEWNNIQDEREITAGLKLYIPRVRKEGPLKYKKLPEDERAKYEVPIKFDRKRFSWPVVGPVVSRFGIRNGVRHDGIDIKAKRGTPIMAAADGKVVFSGRMRGYGNMLIVKHKDRFFTVYAHNSRNKAKKGQRVAKGDIIGYVGSTGRATGSHLHFEVREGEKARNPLFLLPASAKSNIAVAKTEPANEPIVEDKKFSGRREMMKRLKAKRAR